MAEKKFYLYVRPARPKKWWPRDAQGYKFVGALKGGAGWVDGQGDPMTKRQIKLCKECLTMDVRAPRFKVEEAR